MAVVDRAKFHGRNKLRDREYPSLLSLDTVQVPSYLENSPAMATLLRWYDGAERKLLKAANQITKILWSNETKPESKMANKQSNE